jgi:signal transduction histidine kinase
MNSEPQHPLPVTYRIVLACIFFPRLESLAVMLVAASAFLACVILEWIGVLDAHTVLLDDPLKFRNVLPRAFWIIQIGFIFVIWGIIWYLASRLAGALIEREHDLVVTNYRLEKSSKERTRHMLQTTHQLKAPFDAIRSSALLMVEGYCGTLTEDASLVARKIAERCEVVSQQIVDMLQLANLRSEAEAAPPPADVNLAELIERSIARVEPTAERRGIRIEADLEPVTVRAVEDRLKILIENLTSNAVNYSREHGTVTLTCRAVSPEEVELTVRDRGIGIPADKIEKVFNDFYRTNEAVQHNKRSTGLGLAIVRQVARTAGIAVQVESGPGWGTCFTLTIPKNSPDSRTLAPPELLDVPI